MMETPGRRYLALDVMRGLTVVLMILVNMAISPELSYRQLLHSPWNGFTLADAIYPCFLFVVGCALALGLDRGTAAPTRVGWGRIIQRSALLVAWGLFVSNVPFGHVAPAGGWVWQNLGDARLPGVLQRIGLAYLLATSVVRLAGVRGAMVWIVGVLGLSWWWLVAFGDLTLDGSAALKVDRAVFGLAHLYRGEGRPFDPEGLLGSLPATANVLAGYLALRVMRQNTPARGVRVVAAWGLGALPFNKKLWTPSFALLNIGIDALVLAGLAWLIDLGGWRRGTGWLAVFGRNPLALYLIAEVLMALAWTFPLGRQAAFMAIFNQLFAGRITGRFGSLLFGATMVALCWLIGGWLDRRRLYLRL